MPRLWDHPPPRRLYVGVGPRRPLPPVVQRLIALRNAAERARREREVLERRRQEQG